MKIRFVVVNEHTLGYVDPRQPNRLGILSTSLIKGSLYFPVIDGSTVLPTTGVRPATRADFATFRLVPDQYQNDTERYEFPIH